MVRGINMADSYTNLLYHIVFSTKGRRPLITSEYELLLYDYIGGTVRGVGGISLERDPGLSPATAGCGRSVRGSWGSAALHPRLYAVARCRGLGRGIHR